MSLSPEMQALHDAAQGNATKPVAEPQAAPTLAEHEAEFSNTPRLVESAASSAEAPDGTAEPPQPRHRARSQAAKPEDVETIAALTKRLRDAETAAGIEADRKDGESDRVYNLRKRAEQAEALAKLRKPAEAPKPAPAPVVAQPAAFSEAEPTIEQFATAADPYSAWQRALGAYDRRKEAAEAKFADAKTATERQAAQSVENKRQAYEAFNTRVESFKGATADYDAIVKTCERPVTYLMETALVNDPDGPRYVYELAKNPALHDELFILTDHKPVTQESVATVQRLFKSRMPAAATGSVAPLTRPLAPRPPNPVRTVPSAHLSDKAPGDTASLADHERFYGNGRR